MEAAIKNYARELQSLKQIWPIVIGLLVVYGPTVVLLSDAIWPKSEHAHGPIVFLIVLWLFWRRRDAFYAANDTPSTRSGVTLLSLGCVLYALGRSQSILIFEVGSAIPVLMGIMLLTNGAGALKKLWFPILFLVFLIPLPGFLIDALTGPLKQYVSIIVNEMLYIAGYPIARTGVVLTIGPYQLLIADACSGLNSMYALTALGFLYAYLKQNVSKLHIALLLLSILPIAFATNIARVTVLSLLTYYFGDEAGQGFSHDFAAAVEFLIALVLLFSLDAVLSRVLPRATSRGALR